MRKLNLKTLIKLVITASLTATFFICANVAQAASSDCYDITGSTAGSTTQPVLVNGVNNTGTIYFDPPNTPDYKYEACVIDPGSGNAATATQGPFLVKGWAWDDNIGWISFYCGDEAGDGAAPYTNLGVDCGDYIYGVTMEGNTFTGGRMKGELNGYAWADNGGYIDFNGKYGAGATDTYSVIAETAGPCTGMVFGLEKPYPTCSAHLNDKDYIYAWSDNLGWFDLYGVKFPWFDLMGLGVSVKLQITPNPLSADYVAPYGNNSDQYKVDLVLNSSKPGPVTPLSNPAAYYVWATLNWTDSVGTNQTDGSTSIAGNDAIINLPTTFSKGVGPDLYNASVPGLEKTFTSVAPTTAMNFSGTNNFNNQSFILPQSPTPLYNGASYSEGDNSLKFNGITLKIVYVPTGVCVYGSFGACNEIPLLTDYDGGTKLEFKPPVSLDTFDDAINKDYFSLRNLSSAQVHANFVDHCNGACGGANAAITIGLKNTDYFKFVYDDDLADSDEYGFDKNDPSAFGLNVFGDYSAIPIGIVCNLAGGCPAFDSDAYAYSVISYSLGGKSVLYFGNKLPRVTGGLVVNPVAKIVGSVYSTGVTNPQTGTIVRSLGDVSTNILRDTIFRNVSNIIAGAATPTAGATITKFDSTQQSGFWVSPSLNNNVTKLLPDVLAPLIYRVYYFVGNLTFGTGTDFINLTGERTIIVTGGNIFINNNIYKTSGTGKPRLGIIVLKDLTTNKGGNVYIAPNVTNIQANIYADGSVFSYDGNAADINSDGEPVFTDEADRFGKLKNQLYIEGSIASQNTIGGAVATPLPILGDGSTTTAGEGNYGATPAGRSQARLYDLNFLRYYGYVYERFTSGSCIGDAVDQQNPTLCPSDPSYSLGACPSTNGGDCDLILMPGGTPSQGAPAGDASAVLVTFDPPPATLPGFGVTTGAEEQYRTQ
jgi:hypothetical protein